MADVHYYVSLSGNDANTGLSEEQAWRTLDYAASTIVAAVGGDTYCHIAPGTYRETVTADNAGTDATHRIIFQGDPECLWFTNEKPGRVRITAADASEVPHATNYTITSNKDYVEWWNLVVDGGAAGFWFQATGQLGRVVQDCRATGKASAIRYATKAVRCIAVSGGRAIQQVGTADQCLALGGQDGFNTCTNTFNCLGQGGSGAGFYTIATACDNCIAIFSTYGFRAATGTNCIAAWCSTDYLTSAAYPSNSYYLQCGTQNANFSAGTVWSLQWERLLELLPWLAVQAAGNLLRQGTNATAAYSATDTDVSGKRLRLKGSGIDIGPWSIAEGPDTPSLLLDYAVYKTTAPSVKITAEGDVDVKVLGQTSQQITVTCWARHDSITGSKPQVLLVGDGIVTQTGTVTAGDATWEQLTLSVTPTATAPITVILRARNSAGTCNFSDVAIQGAASGILWNEVGGLNRFVGGIGGTGSLAQATIDAIAAAAAAAVLVTPGNKVATNADNAVILQAGTGTGQLDFTSGVVKANTTLIEGSDATNQIRDSVVDDATRIDASALNTLSGHDPGSALATEANQTTILNRLGAWTGTGINTVLGAFRAIAGKLAALTPSDLTSGGVTFDNTTDSLEAQADDHKYQAKVTLTCDTSAGTPTDRYSVDFFRDSEPTVSGITSPSIEVFKEDGTDLIGSTGLTQIGATGRYTHDETTNLSVPGAAYNAVVTWTIDGSARTWPQPVSRHS
jgi:hypothetical protein